MTAPAAPAARPVREATFATHDGVDLYYRHRPATAERRGGVPLFPRGHEHSGRTAHLVDKLALPGSDFFAWDARGHGRSPGERGHSSRVDTSVRDIRTFVTPIGSTYGIAVGDMAVVGQSVGAVLVAAWQYGRHVTVSLAVRCAP
jgi:alpha-beta hydrolase superfamily lysophospholipase